MVVSLVSNFKSNQVISFGNSKVKSSYVAPKMLCDTVEVNKKAPTAFKQAGKVLAGLLFGAATVFTVTGCKTPSDPTPTPVVTPPSTPQTLTALDKKLVAWAQAFNPVEDSLPTETDRFQSLDFEIEDGPGCHYTFESESADKIILKANYTNTQDPNLAPDILVVTESDKGMMIKSTNLDSIIEIEMLPDGSMQETPIYNRDGGVAIYKPGSTPGTAIQYTHTSDGDVPMFLLNVKATFKKLVAKLLNSSKNLIHMG